MIFNQFFLVLFLFNTLHSSVYCVEKSTLLSEEENFFIKNTDKKLTQCGFDAVRICTLNPGKCEAPIFRVILDDRPFEREVFFSTFKNEFLQLNTIALQKAYVYQVLSPWISDEFIELVFEKNSDRSDRARVFIYGVEAFVEKLSKFFLAGKLK
ncbi:MAG TPA: hypothetical protein VL201_00255 [Patescibacteria group bacterium]|nr:hypothetical protein [Patescibacteria group bacterium]